MEIPEGSEPESPKLGVQEHQNQSRSVGLLLDPENEATRFVIFVWWIEQIRLNIETPWENTLVKPLQSIQMVSMRSVEDNHRRIRSIVKDLVTDTPLSYPFMDLLKLLIWNCYGAGNNTFKRNLVEIIRVHKSEILILLETNVVFSTMGNFFNRLGFTASTTVDPISRSGGIWIVWDTI
ncbi:hypothetical protein ACSBR1_036576 [Camellia fascicularis]